MTVEQNKVVGISYTLWDGDGEELESRGEDEPFHYLQGHSNIVPGLEQELEGLEAGDEFDVELAPEDAYGEYDENFVYRISRDEVPAEMDLKPGMPLEMAPEGQEEMRMLVYVKEVAGDEVILDGNQPLAGKHLRFKGKVVETRDATDEEVEHGHAHTGHHHH
jgi:FKBP-type peptidyl-prolyl cis-trans isomerase SlyD